MATFKSSDLGQVQSALNALAQKQRRKINKAARLKDDIKELKEKEQNEELSRVDKSKLKLAEVNHKHVLAEISSLEAEVSHMKELQTSRRADKKKRKAEIFHAENMPQNGNDDAFLADLYGVDPRVVASTNENVVPFENM